MGQISKKAIVVDRNSAFSNHLQEYHPFKVVKILSPLHLNEATLRFAILSKKATFIFINVDEFKKDLTSFINNIREESQDLKFIGFVASNNMYDVYRFGYDDGIRKIVQKKLMEQAINKWLNDDFPSTKEKENYVDSIGQMKSFLDSNPIQQPKIQQPNEQDREIIRNLEQENKRLKTQNEESKKLSRSNNEVLKNQVKQLKKVNANLKEENSNLKKENGNLRKKVDEIKKQEKPLDTPLKETKKVLNVEETKADDLKEKKEFTSENKVKSSKDDDSKTGNSKKIQSKTENIENDIDIPFDIDDLIDFPEENLDSDNDSKNLKKESDQKSSSKKESEIKKDDQYFIDFANNFPQEASKNKEYLNWKKEKDQEKKLLEEKEKQLRNLPNEQFIQQKDNISDLKKNLAKNLNRIKTVKSEENSNQNEDGQNQSEISIEPISFNDIDNLKDISKEIPSINHDDELKKQREQDKNKSEKTPLDKEFNPRQYDKQYNSQYNNIGDKKAREEKDNQFSIISPDEPIPDLNLQHREIKKEKPIYKQPPKKSELKEEVEENSKEANNTDDIESAESEFLDDENLISPFEEDSPKNKKSGVLKNMGTFFSKIFKFE